MKYYINISIKIFYLSIYHSMDTATRVQILDETDCYFT